MANEQDEQEQIVYKGTMKICLWYRAHPSSGQESGPPIPNYYIEFNGKDEIFGDGFTDENGCLSIYFQSTWPGSVLSVGFKRHNGSTSTRIYPSALNQTVDFGDLSMDSLPEKYFRPKYDCSKCDSFYIDADFNINASAKEESPLEQHSCASNKWGFDCCGYDWNTKRCGVQQFFPSFQFLHECSECPLIQYEDDDDDDDDDHNDNDGEPPVDCSTCDKYYAQASMGTPSAERGSLYNLTGHACSHEDQNVDGKRFGSSCCTYDYKTKQCGIFEFNQHYVYLHETEGQFLHPCGGTCKNNEGLGAISNAPTSAPTNNEGIGAMNIGIIVSAVLILLLVLAFSVRFLRRRQSNNNDIDDLGDGQEVKNKKHRLNEQNTNSNDTLYHPTAPSAPPMENEIDVVVVATPILGNTSTVFQAELSS
mmetsp:Transcript_608/g.795  ORF Transcript_608/g.795 Transcript_608/m.795 type:complete len:421 (-) Transcript_608:240-1502(-)